MTNNRWEGISSFRFVFESRPSSSENDFVGATTTALQTPVALVHNEADMREMTEPREKAKMTQTGENLFPPSSASFSCPSPLSGLLPTLLTCSLLLFPPPSFIPFLLSPPPFCSSPCWYAVCLEFHNVICVVSQHKSGVTKSEILRVKKKMAEKESGKKLMR